MKNRSSICFLITVLTTVFFAGPSLVRGGEAAPVAVTLPAAQMLNDAATLNGEVNPGGAETTVWYEWGTSRNYSHTTSPQSVGAGTNLMAVSEGLGALRPGLVYHYRVAASNSVGVVHGGNETFWIPAIVFNGPAPLTNECHQVFADPGASVRAFPRTLAAGYIHNLAVRADSTVIGWGYDYFGQTAAPSNATNVVAIAAGGNHSLALLADGTVLGWGAFDSGQTSIPAGATNVVAITAGYDHSLAVRTDGTVLGWGYNASGQTTIPTSATNVVAIAAGDYHSLALRADGTVIGWGDNSHGQTTIPTSATNVVAVAAGGYHNLVLRANGTVIDWGYDPLGPISAPPGATNVVAISAGDHHSLALRVDGTIIGWGNNYYGQISVPSGATNVVAISAGGSHSLALLADGTVLGWGYNQYQQSTIPAGVSKFDLPLHIVGTVDANSPGSYLLSHATTNGLGAIATATRTVVVADTQPPLLTLVGETTMAHSLNAPFIDPGAVATDLCEGDLTGSIVSNITVNPGIAGVYSNTFSATDAFGNQAQSIRIVVVGLSRALTLPASGMVNDEATLNGQVNPGGIETSAWFEWGASELYGHSTVPMAVGADTNDTTLSDGLDSLIPGVVYHYRVTASNSMGVVRGGDETFWIPAIVLNGPSLLTNECHEPFSDLATVGAFPTAIGGGVYFGLALRADGTVIGWGNNAYGQITIPAVATNVVGFAAGGFHSLAVRADGTVVGWGENYSGQTAVPASATNVVGIAAGRFHSLALRADGSLIGWGDNSYGQTTIPTSATNLVAVAAGGYQGLALRADGKVVGWGDNSAGPTNGPASATNVVGIAQGSHHSLALRADGTVIGWGNNGFGQVTIPTSASNVVAVAAGVYHSLALRADGTVVGWGGNSYGQTSIPEAATNVVKIAAGSYFSLALRADGAVVGWGINDLGQTSIANGVNVIDLPVAISGTVDVNSPGSYPLTYSTTNGLGAVAAATRTVVVVDTRPPLLTLLGDNPTTMLLGDEFSDPGATATDLCGGDMSGGIVSNLTVNPGVAGIYTNSFSVIDGSGNLAQARRRVFVVGAPEITSATVAAPGQFQLEGTGTGELTYTVQTSTNLLDWMDYTNVVASPEGMIQYVEEVDAHRPAWFYKLRWP